MTLVGVTWLGHSLSPLRTFHLTLCRVFQLVKQSNHDNDKFRNKSSQSSVRLTLKNCPNLSPTRLFKSNSKAQVTIFFTDNFFSLFASIAEPGIEDSTKKYI
jgi:hypothetical protein